MILLLYQGMDVVSSTLRSTAAWPGFRQQRDAVLAVALAEVCRRRLVRAVADGNLELTAQQLDRLRLLHGRIPSGSVSARAA